MVSAMRFKNNVKTGAYVVLKRWDVDKLDKKSHNAQLSPYMTASGEVAGTSNDSKAVWLFNLI